MASERDDGYSYIYSPMLTLDGENGDWTLETYDIRNMSCQPYTDGDEDETTCEGLLPNSYLKLTRQMRSEIPQSTKMRYSICS